MQHIASRLLEIVAETPGQLARFSVEEMTCRPAPGKWSKREILGHLCDSALHNLQRFLYAQRESESHSYFSYPQEDLVRLNGYQDLPTAQVLALWGSLNRQIAAVLKTLPAAKLPLPVELLASGERVTLGFIIKDYLAHLEHHLRQIFPGEKMPARTLPANWRITLDEALAALAQEPQGKPFATLLERGSLQVEIYAPKKADLQTPHDRDELYVVASGEGTFFNGGERRPFGAGDVLFVPAGVEHRFEEFTEDFKTWVVFF